MTGAYEPLRCLPAQPTGCHCEATGMEKARDKRFDWVAALAVICGVAVIVPSLLALAASLFAALAALL
jgi:hypothetical protein